MHISDIGLALLKECEGFSAQAYVCPAGKLTIGYGHVICAGEHFPHEGISKEAGEILLKKDVTVSEQAVLRLAGEGLLQGQFDALVCLVYNIGTYAFEKSTLLRLLRLGDMEGVVSQFGRWVYAGGYRMPGLVYRRAKERALFLA